MIYGSNEASIEEFIEIKDEMDAKSWFIKHLFSGNKVFKPTLSCYGWCVARRDLYFNLLLAY